VTRIVNRCGNENSVKYEGSKATDTQVQYHTSVTRVKLVMSIFSSAQCTDRESNATSS